MNDSKNSSNGLLVLRMSEPLTQEQIETLVEAITPTANALGLEPMVLGNGADVRIETGSAAVLARVCEALEAMVKQGEPPELSEPQIAPQALNARSTGLNNRTILDAVLAKPLLPGSPRG
jgi:hypothetical protein